MARQLGNAGSEKMLAVEENDLLGYKRLDAVAVFDLNENAMVQWGHLTAVSYTHLTLPTKRT